MQTPKPQLLPSLTEFTVIKRSCWHCWLATHRKARHLGTMSRNTDLFSGSTYGKLWPCYERIRKRGHCISRECFYLQKRDREECYFQIRKQSFEIFGSAFLNRTEGFRGTHTEPSLLVEEIHQGSLGVLPSARICARCCAIGPGRRKEDRLESSSP